QNGVLHRNDQGPPIPGPDGNPLDSRQTLLKSIAATDKLISEEIDKTQTLMDQAEFLTFQMNGQGQEKGLRHLLDELETTHRNTLGELEYLKPFRYNRQAEADLLQKRQASLKGRVAELNRAARN